MYEASMEVNLSAGHWYFKRAARSVNGSSNDDWHPGVEAAVTETAGHDKHGEGENDPRLDKWLPVHHMPSNIHVELIHHGIISDPSLGMNEAAVQCKCGK
jgi:hypothetical protein